MNKIAKLSLLFVTAVAAVGNANAQTVATIGLDTLQFENNVSGIKAPENIGEISATVSAQLKQQLLATRKFNVLSYTQVTELLAAQGLSVEAITDTQSDGSIHAEGVDYVLSAVVTNLDTRKEASDPIKLDLTLRPTASFLNEIKSSATITPNNVDGIASTLGSLTYSMVTEVVANVFPVRVMRISENGTLTLNYGAGVLRQGDRLEVFTPIERSNNGSVERGPVQGKVIAKIEITDTSKKFASAKVIEGTDQINRGYKAKPL